MDRTNKTTTPSRRKTNRINEEQTRRNITILWVLLFQWAKSYRFHRDKISNLNVTIKVLRYQNLNIKVKVRGTWRGG